MFQLHGTPCDSIVYDPLFVQVDQIKFSTFNLSLLHLPNNEAVHPFKLFKQHHLKASSACIELANFKTYHD